MKRPVRIQLPGGRHVDMDASPPPTRPTVTILDPTEDDPAAVDLLLRILTALLRERARK